MKSTEIAVLLYLWGSSLDENKIDLAVMCAVGCTLHFVGCISHKDCVLHKEDLMRCGLEDADSGIQWEHMAPALWWNTVVVSALCALCV